MTVYQFTVDWTIPAFLTGLCLALVFGHRIRQITARTAFLVGIVTWIGALIWLGTSLSHRLALATGATSVVAGPVLDFRPAPHKGIESFRVDTTWFGYSPELTQFGYHRRASNGGVIRPGAKVRLYFVHQNASPADSFGNIILRIDPFPERLVPLLRRLTTA